MVDLPGETYLTEFNTTAYSISVDFGTPKQIVTLDVSGFYDYDVPTPLLANITYTRYGGFYIFETADNLNLYDIAVNVGFIELTYSSEIFKKHFIALMTVTYSVLSSEVLRPALIVLNESGTTRYQSNPISAFNKDNGYLIRNGDYVEL